MRLWLPPASLPLMPQCKVSDPHSKQNSYPSLFILCLYGGVYLDLAVPGSSFLISKISGRGWLGVEDFMIHSKHSCSWRYFRGPEAPVRWEQIRMMMSAKNSIIKHSVILLPSLVSRYWGKESTNK